MPNRQIALADILRSLPQSYRWIHPSVDSLAESIEITHLSHDHRESAPGSLHFCIRGQHFDGHDFAHEAVNNGALAIVCAYQIDGLPVPQIVVDNVREAMAHAAVAFYGNPSQSLAVVGITGTNGKTTTSHMLGDLVAALDQRVAVYGTLTGQRTTPESIVFQRRLAEAVASRLDVVVVEVTSHSLVQHRTDGTRFRVAAFTNLGHDHLDFHESMDDYFAAKARLFTPAMSERCVVDVSTSWGQKLAAMISPDRLVAVDTAEVPVTGVGPSGATITWRGHEVRLLVAPRFARSNAIMAAEIAVAVGHEPERVAAALSSVSGVRGRFELIDLGQPFSVLVDFAHTPDAIGALLAGAREVFGDAPITLVFGCGGERDAEKRRPMGAIASELADRVVLTSDNPRREDPEAIIDDILDGVPSEARERVVVEVDRAKAIGLAIRTAEDGSVVLVAGKGHEQFQDTGGRRVPFQDHEVARVEIERRGDG